MSSSDPIPRSVNDRRQPVDRRNLSPLALECLEACRVAGVIFVGIQSGVGEIPDQCLFRRDTNDTGLSVDAEGISPARLTNRVEAHRLEQRSHFERFRKPIRLSLTADTAQQKRKLS